MQSQYLVSHPIDDWEHTRQVVDFDINFDATPTINLQVTSALLSSTTLPTYTTFRNNLHSVGHQESHHSCLQASKLAVHATSIGTRYTMHMCVQS